MLMFFLYLCTQKFLADYEINCNRTFHQVIQHRSTGNVNFDRDWDEYKRGFGSPDGDHWLGK